LIVELAARRVIYDQPRRPVELLLRKDQRGLGLLERRDPGMQQRDLVFDILDRLLQLPAPTPGQGFDAAHVGPSRCKIRLCGIDSRLLHGDGVPKRLLVEFNEKLTLVHAIVVINENPGNLTVDARGDERHMAVYVRVVGRNRAEHEPDPGNPIRRRHNDHRTQRTDQ